MDVPTRPEEPQGFRRGGVALAALGPVAAAAIIAAAGDITLLVDRSGVVRDVAVSVSETVDPEQLDTWLDRPVAETVTEESRAKVETMLREAAVGVPHRWRQVNHPLDPQSPDPEQRQIPVRYLALAAGPVGPLVFIGRDMRAEARLQQRLLAAQQAMERDYLRLRQAESRYRLLFDISSEPVIIVETASRRITDANPAALRLTGGRDPSLTGQPFASLFAEEDREAALALLAAAGQAREPVSALLHVGPDRHPATVSVTLFRQQNATHSLVRLLPSAIPEPRDDTQAAALAALDRLPDAFVLADDGFRVLAANGAFLDLAEAATLEQVAGQPLANWLGRPGIDMGLLEAALREEGSLRNFATLLRGGLGAEEDVEVSAVALTHNGRHLHGIAIRPVSRRLADAPGAGLPGLPRSVEQLTELVGRVSLKEIVREATDLIERLCIEAALDFTGNNRASAAEMLGLSRQSLYSKLRRHGLGNLAVAFD